jgi:hypothetical protein
LILDSLAKGIHVSLVDLEYQVKESLESLLEIPIFSSMDALHATIAAVFVEKFSTDASFPCSRFFVDEKKILVHFIRTHLLLCKRSMPNLLYGDRVRRVQALYFLACQLPQNLSEDAIKTAYEVMLGKADEKIGTPLPQALFAFVAAELALNVGPDSLERIFQAYRDAQGLPLLREQENDFLEIMIWKILSDGENLLEKLTFRMGQRIEEEIAYILIDQPTLKFSAVVHEGALFFQRINEITSANKWPEIERKIHSWAIQGDMIYRWIHLDQEKPLFQHLLKKLKQGHFLNDCFDMCLVPEVTASYLTVHPDLLPYTNHVKARMLSAYKYLWYTSLSMPEESAFDRFLLWHAQFLRMHAPQLEEDQLVVHLQQLCSKMIPLLPFNAAHCQTLIKK